MTQHLRKTSVKEIVANDAIGPLINLVKAAASTMAKQCKVCKVKLLNAAGWPGLGPRICSWCLDEPHARGQVFETGSFDSCLLIMAN